MESVFASDLPPGTQTIVINDASPEPELIEYLKREASERRIILLHNSENLGFVTTVNRGMALNSTHDVVLLNSDTEVANNWLERLHDAAYRNSRIGTATPFSNNATICSYPRFCEENPLIAGMNTVDLDMLCMQANPGITIDIPTAVGFCMYIRRDCLDETGLFNDQLFKKGYGEEVDFCMRASRRGWKHVLAADTFVYHVGGVSFAASQDPPLRNAKDLLLYLHPNYFELVRSHIQADPARPARLALDCARLRNARKPLHMFICQNQGDEVLKQMQELSDLFSDQLEFLLLTAEADHISRFAWLSKNEAFSLFFNLAQNEDLTNFITLLIWLGVMRIHYHHSAEHLPVVHELPSMLSVTYDNMVNDPNYAADYVIPDEKRKDPEATPILSRLARYAYAPKKHESLFIRLRHKLVDGLVRLRSSTWLRFFVRLVPLSWQRSVINLLTRKL